VLVASDERTNNAFIFFVADVKNTGNYGGLPATSATSAIAGVYRLLLDDAGEVTDVWLYRNGTPEERRHLLKGEHDTASNGSSKGGQQQQLASWAARTPLLACSWVVDPPFLSRMMLATNIWMTEVWSKASLQSLMAVASPDVLLCDGTGYEREQGHQLQGVEAVGRWLLQRCLRKDLGPVVNLAMVAEPQGNKVFVHWQQPVRERAALTVAQPQGGGEDAVDGILVLVFDERGKVAQVVDFHAPSAWERAALFRADAPPPVELDAGDVAGLAAASQAKQAAEEAEAMRRQEMEWTNF